MAREAAPSALQPDAQAWRDAAARALKGGPFERLVTRTLEGLEIEPLYDADTAPPRSSVLGRARREPGWDIRACVDHPDPARANDLALEALRGGCASILLRIDPTGRDDVALALEGVLLDAAPVAVDAGFRGPLVAQWLGELAKGAPAAALAFHLDPLGAFAEAGESPGPIEAHIGKSAEAAVRLGRTYPRASLFLASGRVVYEAGGSAVQELGVMAAAALAYVKALAAAGLSVEEAFARLTLGLAVDADVLVSLAKVRAARELWGRLAAACGAAAPARIEARSSARMLTAVDPWTNLLRLALAGFAGAAGGADALVLGAFTDALGRPAEPARRLARNTQLILMQEAGLAHVEDPAAGAWAIEALTDQLARQAWGVFQAIERQGGLIAALSSGLIAVDVGKVCEARRAAIAGAELSILGVSLYPDLDPAPVTVDDAETIPVAAPPDVRMPGPDSRCPPLRPHRIAETAELVCEDLTA